MRITFCGVRGSTAAPGKDFLRYGGSTSCIAVAVPGERPSLLLDGGTGLQAVGPLLAGRPFDGTVLLGHLHWDHTHGLPFFAAGTQPGARVRVLIPDQGCSAEGVLDRCFSPPHFPVSLRSLGPGWSVAAVPEGRHILEGFEVLAREIPHPGGRTFGYRVSYGPASMAYLSDHSPTSAGDGPDGLGERHEAALQLAAGVDVLVHDAQHLAAEFPEVAYLGHASAEYALELAREAGARHLVLFHHAPTRTDDQVDALLADLQGRGVRVSAAAEGLVLDLPGCPSR